MRNPAPVRWCPRGQGKAPGSLHAVGALRALSEDAGHGTSMAVGCEVGVMAPRSGPGCPTKGILGVQKKA